MAFFQPINKQTITIALSADLCAWMNGVIIAAFQPPIYQDMRHLALVITVSLFPFLLLSCGHKKGIPPEQVESITFYAMPKDIETPNAIVSFQTLKRGYRDTLIVDRDFIREFTTMVNDLIPDRTVNRMDMRSAAVLATKTGDSLFVAFGENWGTAILRDHGKDKSPFDVNGKFMKDNPDLFRFIDEYVYGPHPRDYWFDDESRAFLRMVERSERLGYSFQPELTNAVFETIDFDKEQGEYFFPDSLLCAGVWFDFRGDVDSVHVLGGPMPLYDEEFGNPKVNFIGYYEGRNCLISVASLGKQDDQTVDRFVETAYLSKDKDAYKMAVDKVTAPLSEKNVCAFLQSSYTIEPDGSLLLKSRRLRR